MPDFGFPPQSLVYRVGSAIRDLRGQADILQVEAVTGQPVDPAKSLDGRTGEVYILQKALEDTRNYASTIALAEGRATATQASISQIRENVATVTRDVTSALESRSAETRDVAAKGAELALESIVSALRTSFGERSLFAGDNGDALPIVDADTILAETLTVLNAAATPGAAFTDLTNALETPGGLYDMTLYQGGTGVAPAVEVAQGERVDYAVRADELAFRRTIRDIAVLALALDETSALTDDRRETLINSALNAIRSDANGLVEITARVGIAEARISEAKSENFAEEVTLSVTLDELASADTFEAAGALTAVERQIEIAYATTARISNLSLANYIT